MNYYTTRITLQTIQCNCSSIWWTKSLCRL